MYDWFVDHKVRIEDFPDYIAEEYAMLFSTLQENPHLDRKRYAARLGNLPKHVRKAWLLGERVVEGQYFEDFHPSRQVTEEGVILEEESLESTLERIEWHVIGDLPTLNGRSILRYSWINIYRCLDWGYFPDPAVCIWVAVLANKWAIAFKEKTWRKTVAAKVAKEIKEESRGMHVVTTFCDPTMFIKHGETDFSIGEIMESNGVPLTQSINRRDLLGYAIHQYLNTIIDEGPQLQIVQPMGPYGCKELIRTLPQIQMDPSDPTKMAEGEDHWVIALSYFCSGEAMPAPEEETQKVPFWMQPKSRYPR
jgi:hypothetical protein